MSVVLVGMGQTPVYCTKVLSRGPTGTIALPSSPFVHVITRTGEVAVVVLQQAAHAQQVPHTHQVWPQFIHHRFGLGASVEVELSAEDGRKDVELLVGQIFRGSGH